MQDFFDNAEPRLVAMLLVGLVVLIVGAEATYLVWPQFKKFQAQNTSHVLLESTVANSDSLSSQLINIDTEVKDLLRQLHGDMAQLPVKEMESSVIGRLQKVSWATNVELISVKPGSGGQIQNFRERLFQVKLRAGYHNFFEWLQTVNQELGYIVVKEFEITPNDPKSLSNPKLDLTLTLISYRIEKKNAS